VKTEKLTGEVIFAYYARRMERELGLRRASGPGRRSPAVAPAVGPGPASVSRAASAPVRLTIGADGRVVIPVDLRRAMALDETGTALARIVDGVLALLWDEPGADRVAEVLPVAQMSAVNVAELIGKLIDRGASDSEAIAVIRTLGVVSTSFDERQAVACGVLRRRTRAAGLSLGDRACLALAQSEGAVALTADRSWTAAGIDIRVEVIR
jgi:PIN domain nuclease of toxin-antitoxin system